jgi:hypothetical protein
MSTYKYVFSSIITSKLQKHMPDENNLLIWQVEMDRQ